MTGDKNQTNCLQNMNITRIIKVALIFSLSSSCNDEFNASDNLKGVEKHEIYVDNNTNSRILLMVNGNPLLSTRLPILLIDPAVMIEKNPEVKIYFDSIPHSGVGKELSPLSLK